ASVGSSMKLTGSSSSSPVAMSSAMGSGGDRGMRGAGTIGPGSARGGGGGGGRGYGRRVVHLDPGRLGRAPGREGEHLGLKRWRLGRLFDIDAGGNDRNPDLAVEIVVEGRAPDDVGVGV